MSFCFVCSNVKFTMVITKNIFCFYTLDIILVNSSDVFSKKVGARWPHDRWKFNIIKPLTVRIILPAIINVFICKQWYYWFTTVKRNVARKFATKLQLAQVPRSDLCFYTLFISKKRARSYPAVNNSKQLRVATSLRSLHDSFGRS